MIVVLDTNVLYQALRDSSGASHFIFQLIRAQQIEITVSVPVFQEYRAVLLRAQSLADIGLTRKEVETVLHFIAYVAKPTTIHFLMRPNLTDEDDNMFVDLAFASNSRFIITSNTTDFVHRTELKFDFEIVTPSQFVQIWRKDYG
jgi:putative PIN family toxin of toxin-antitoxin system